MIRFLMVKMNLSEINERLRNSAMRCVNMINTDAKHYYAPNFIEAFKSNRYYQFKRICEWYNYIISAKVSMNYRNMIHIYENLKSCALNSYAIIDLNELIEIKICNLIEITIDDFMGVYVSLLKSKIIYDISTPILLEFRTKEKVLRTLMDKIKFKDLMKDYSKNASLYIHNRLDVLLGNRELARYLSEFI